MAEAWARHLKADVIKAYSAGIKARGIDPHAVKVMAEAGVDITTQRSKLINELKEQEFDYVITLCSDAYKQCPYFPARIKVIYHGFADPPRLADKAKSEQEVLVHYRHIRDEIRAFVQSLPQALSEKK